MKSLLIIGGSSFLGKSFIDYASSKTFVKWKINELILLSRRKVNIKLKKNKKIKIKFIRSDIGKIKKIPKAEYIIYAANSQTHQSNLKAIRNFSILIKKIPIKTKILFTSSGAVYGNENKIKKITEQDKTNLKKILRLDKSKRGYAKTKIKIEKIFKSLGKKKYNVSIARMFTFIGKRILNNKNYAISDFVYSAIHKKEIIVNSSHSVYRSYMHSDDMVNWLIRILISSSPKCPVYNVGSDRAITIKNLAKLVGKIFKKPVILKQNKNKKIDSYVPSIKKGKKNLGLRINYSLTNLLKSIYIK